MDGIEEVHPEEALRAGEAARHLRDGEARGVRREEARSVHGGLELPEHLPLDRHPLRDGLDHQIERAKPRVVEASADPLHPPGRLTRGHAAGPDGGIEERAGAGETAGDGLAPDVHQVHRVAARGRELRDPSAHRARAHHPDPADPGRRLLRDPAKPLPRPLLQVEEVDQVPRDRRADEIPGRPPLRLEPPRGGASHGAPEDIQDPERGGIVSARLPDDPPPGRPEDEPARGRRAVEEAVGEGGPPAGAGWRARDPLPEEAGGVFGEAGVGEEIVDKPDAPRLASAERPGREERLEGAPEPHEPGEPRRSAPRREDPEPDLREPDPRLRVVGGDPVVACEGEFGPAPHARPVDRGDGGDRELLQLEKDLVPDPGDRLGRVPAPHRCKLADVGAHDEGRLPARDENPADLPPGARLAQPAQDPREALHRPAREDVRRPVRRIEDEVGEPPVLEGEERARPGVFHARGPRHGKRGSPGIREIPGARARRGARPGGEGPSVRASPGAGEAIRRCRRCP